MPQMCKKKGYIMNESDMRFQEFVMIDSEKGTKVHEGIAELHSLGCTQWSVSCAIWDSL